MFGYVPGHTMVTLSDHNKAYEQPYAENSNDIKETQILKRTSTEEAKKIAHSKQIWNLKKLN
jgi:hypothetical protein